MQRSVVPSKSPLVHHLSRARLVGRLMTTVKCHWVSVVQQSSLSGTQMCELTGVTPGWFYGTSRRAKGFRKWQFFILESASNLLLGRWAKFWKKQKKKNLVGEMENLWLQRAVFYQRVWPRPMHLLGDVRTQQDESEVSSFLPIATKRLMKNILGILLSPVTWEFGACRLNNAPETIGMTAEVWRDWWGFLQAPLL